MLFENLKIATDNGIAVVTINRPEVLNALDERTLLELLEFFTAVARADEVLVVIITGSGEKAFAAGADIAAMQSLSVAEARRFAKFGHRVMRSIENCPKPVVAGINGFALGGGCELALACDIRIAAENARFGQPEVGLGIIPGFGGTQRLTRLVGKGRALEMILSGEMIDAAEAHRIGLVNKVVPAEHLQETAIQLAMTILSKSPHAVRLAKEAICNGLELDLDRANQYEAELFGLCFTANDQKEGMQAFLEKRPAEFEGK